MQELCPPMMLTCLPPQDQVNVLIGQHSPGVVGGKVVPDEVAMVKRTQGE